MGEGAATADHGTSSWSRADRGRGAVPKEAVQESRCPPLRCSPSFEWPAYVLYWVPRNAASKAPRAGALRVFEK